MPATPPPDKPAPPAGTTRAVTVELPADLAAWLEDRAGVDPAARSEVVAGTLDAARRSGGPPARSFGTAEDFLTWYQSLPEDPPGEAPMGEIVRDIYRRRGYPMEHFVFGPDADIAADSADIAADSADIAADSADIAADSADIAADANDGAAGGPAGAAKKAA